MKNKLQQLLAASYKNGKLDPETVAFISDQVSRHMLKQYIRLLKQNEQKNQIIVTSSIALTEQDRKVIKAQFPEKDIVYIFDPELISGIQIINNDQKYEVNLNQRFNDIMRHLNHD